MSCAGFDKSPFAPVSLETTRVMSYSTICGKLDEIVTPGKELSEFLLVHWAAACCWEITLSAQKIRPKETKGRMNIHTSQSTNSEDILGKLSWGFLSKAVP
jgi:hypothetical protein